VTARYCDGGFPPPLVRHRVAGLGEPLAAQTRRVGDPMTPVAWGEVTCT